MKISQSGLDAIKRHEGLRLTAYPDPASGGDPITIGYGHTRDVERGQTITHAQAEQFLREDLAWVETCIERSVKVPLTQGQYDALASLIFNIGAGAFTTSTLLKMLNAGDYAGAAEQFARWNIAAGRVNLGLTNRRAAEQALFLSDLPPAAPAPKPPAREAWMSDDPAQREQQQYAPETTMPLPLAPIVTALAPAFLEMLPKLGAWFGSGSKSSERNLAVVGEAIKLAQTTVGAVNALDAVEKMKANPAARAQVEQAVEANWYVLTEAGGGGIAGARAADAAAVASDGPWWQVLRSPSFLIAIPLLGLVYIIVLSLVGVLGNAEWSQELRGALAGTITGAIVGGLVGYYYGQMTSRNRTTPPASERAV